MLVVNIDPLDIVEPVEYQNPYRKSGLFAWKASDEESAITERRGSWQDAVEQYHLFIMSKQNCASTVLSTALKHFSTDVTLGKAKRRQTHDSCRIFPLWVDIKAQLVGFESIADTRRVSNLLLGLFLQAGNIEILTYALHRRVSQDNAKRTRLAVKSKVRTFCGHASNSEYCGREEFCQWR